MGFFSSPSPFPYRDYQMKTGNPNENLFSYGDFTSIPKWSWTPYGNGLGTGESPYGNGELSIPVSIW
jgi:hypothetical protein